jgi:hypothetical protein
VFAAVLTGSPLLDSLVKGNLRLVVVGKVALDGGKAGCSAVAKSIFCS